MRNSCTSREGRTKHRWLSKWLLGAAALVCLANCANALDPNRAMSQYIHDQWGAEQGFPGGPVYAIAQTPDGYLWLGTEKGLVRFDGLSFRLLEHSDSTTLPIGPVLGLAVDAEGNLWVGTTRGIERLRDTVFTTYSVPGGPLSESTGPVYADSDGRTWLAPSEGGLYWLKEGQVNV